MPNVKRHLVDSLNVTGPSWSSLPSTARRSGTAWFTSRRRTDCSLLSAEEEAVEAAIWAAARLLDQRANLLTMMAAKDRDAQRPRMVERHDELAREAREHARRLRGMIVAEEPD